MDPESFARGGSFDNVFYFIYFLIEEGREDPKSTISGPSSALRWHTDDDPTLVACLVALWFSGDLDKYC